MQRLRNVSVSRHLLIACFMAYAVTTAAKMCVPTVISSMVSENILSKGESGFLSGIFYLVYGVLQVVFGKYFNRHAPYMGVKLALFGSALCCVLMSFTTNFYLLVAIWCLCAAFNAGFFPAVMKIVSSSLAGRHSVWANKFFSTAYQLGYIVCLLAGSVIIQIIGWQMLYYFGALLSVLALAYWIYAERQALASLATLPPSATPELPKHELATTQNRRSVFSYFGSGVFCLFALSFVNALLNNGVKSWIPTIVMETYSTTPSFSTLLNVVVVVMNFVFLMVVGMLIPPGKLRAALTMLFISIPLLILMHFTDLLNEYWYVALVGVFTSFMSYIGNLIPIQIPFHFKQFDDVSRISGIMNMCCSFGVLISSYAYGFFADLYGWMFIMNMWVAFTVVAIILLFIAMPLWTRFLKRNHLNAK